MNSASARGNPVNPIASVRAVAPIRINAIIAEVLVAPSKLSMKVCLVSEPCTAARMNAPITPMEAASVAVAQPPYMDPMTTRISRMIGIRKRLSRSFSEKLMRLAIFGTSPGRRKDQPAT